MKETQDIIVVGAGPAGIAAAIAASQNGRSVMMIEKSESIGGMVKWLNVLKGSASSYLFDLISDIAVRAYSYLLFDEHEVLRLLSELLVENNIKIKSNATVFDVKMDGHRISGIKVLTKQGIIKLKGNIFIDCSGDGSLCSLAEGHSMGGLSEISKTVKLGGITDQIEPFNPDTWRINAPLPDLISNVELLPTQRLGVCSAHVTCTAKENIDETSAEIMFNHELSKLMAHLKQTQDGFENCYIQSISTQSKHNPQKVESEYSLTRKDMTSGKIFDDWVATRIYMEGSAESKKENSFFAGDKAPNGPLPLTIPYKAICAKGINNLLIAGTSALPSIQSVPTALATGQAAGTAAAIAAKKQCKIKDVNIKKLQSILLKSGVKIPRILKVTTGISPIVDDIIHVKEKLPHIPEDASQILHLKVSGLSEEKIDEIIEDN